LIKKYLIIVFAKDGFFTSQTLTLSYEFHCSILSFFIVPKINDIIIEILMFIGLSLNLTDISLQTMCGTSKFLFCNENLLEFSALDKG